jgi:PAS domain S-box-containing protein
LEQRIKKRKILIVEDEHIIAVDIRVCLEDLGYDVIGTISNGEDAIEFIGQAHPELILMDIMLDGDVNGLEVAEHVNQNFDIPVIFLTAYANDETLKKAAKASPHGYLIKPFEDRELRVSIEMAFYKHEMERALKASRNFLMKVMDTVPSCIFIKDAEKKFVMANKAFADLYQIPPKQIVGKTEKDLVSENENNKVRTELFNEGNELVLQKKETILIPEQLLTMPDGKELWFQTTKVPMLTPKGEDVVLGVAVDITSRKKITEELKQSNIRLKKLLEETVNGLVSAMEMRDPYTAGHQRRVSYLACKIAEEMKLPQNQIDGIRIASLVHDIGKIYVPSEILSKPGKLSDAEMNLIKTHPKAGFDILCRIQFPWPVANIVLQHQERKDGRGYPDGRAGDEIMLEAKILSVADVVEAIASHRPYRPALGIDVALGELDKNRGILYDENVVDVCLDLFRNDKFKFADIPLSKRH